jgi:hypothetical protein
MQGIDDPSKNVREAPFGDDSSRHRLISNPGFSLNLPSTFLPPIMGHDLYTSFVFIINKNQRKNLKGGAVKKEVFTHRKHIT